MTINISPALPLGLRIRLFVERLLAATGPDAERHFEAERRFKENSMVPAMNYMGERG